MGGWAIAQSPILNTTITVAKLTQRGYESLLTYYYKVSPHYQRSPLFGFADFQFPLFNEPSWFTGKTRTYGGVRGSPC